MEEGDSINHQLHDNNNTIVVLHDYCHNNNNNNNSLPTRPCSTGEEDPQVVVGWG